MLPGLGVVSKAAVNVGSRHLRKMGLLLLSDVFPEVELHTLWLVYF